MMQVCECLAMSEYATMIWYKQTIPAIWDYDCLLDDIVNSRLSDQVLLEIGDKQQKPAQREVFLK